MLFGKCAVDCTSKSLGRKPLNLDPVYKYRWRTADSVIATVRLIFSYLGNGFCVVKV